MQGKPEQIKSSRQIRLEQQKQANATRTAQFEASRDQPRSPTLSGGATYTRPAVITSPATAASPAAAARPAAAASSNQFAAQNFIKIVNEFSEKVKTLKARHDQPTTRPQDIQALAQTIDQLNKQAHTQYNALAEAVKHNSSVISALSLWTKAYNERLDITGQQATVTPPIPSQQGATQHSQPAAAGTPGPNTSPAEAATQLTLAEVFRRRQATTGATAATTQPSVGQPASTLSATEQGLMQASLDAVTQAAHSTEGTLTAPAAAGTAASSALSDTEIKQLAINTALETLTTVTKEIDVARNQANAHTATAYTAVNNAFTGGKTRVEVIREAQAQVDKINGISMDLEKQYTKALQCLTKAKEALELSNTATQPSSPALPNPQYTNVIDSFEKQITALESRIASAHNSFDEKIIEIQKIVHQAQNRPFASTTASAPAATTTPAVAMHTNAVNLKIAIEKRTDDENAKLCIQQKSSSATETVYTASIPTGTAADPTHKTAIFTATINHTSGETTLKAEPGVSAAHLITGFQEKFLFVQKTSGCVSFASIGDGSSRESSAMRGAIAAILNSNTTINLSFDNPAVSDDHITKLLTTLKGTVNHSSAIAAALQGDTRALEIWTKMAPIAVSTPSGASVSPASSTVTPSTTVSSGASAVGTPSAPAPAPAPSTTASAPSAPPASPAATASGTASPVASAAGAPTTQVSSAASAPASSVTAAGANRSVKDIAKEADDQAKARIAAQSRSGSRPWKDVLETGKKVATVAGGAAYAAMEMTGK